MPRKTQGGMSQTFKIERAKKILKLSEKQIIRVLKGETDLKQKDITAVALELYKRRIPIHADKGAGSNKLTVIKIVKNHIPAGHKEFIDINEVDEATDAIISKIEPRKLAKLEDEVEEDE